MADKESGRARPAGIAEFLLAELRHAVQDIRQKVVEQGWFGRTTTTKPVEVHNDIAMQPAERMDAPSLDALRRPSFDELWGPREQEERCHDHPHVPERGIDIGR